MLKFQNSLKTNLTKDIDDTLNKNKYVSIEEFLSTLKSYQTELKLLHWKATGVGGFASHLAFAECESAVGGIVDTLVEVNQLDKLLNLSIPAVTLESEEPSMCVKEMLEYVRNNRYIFKYSFIQNEIDTLELALSMCLYKLTLK